MIVKKLYQKQNIQLNYYEIKNNLQPLILIHAQGVDAVRFENVWGQLSKSYHIYSVDCYGHGESLHNAKQYNVEDISKAIICFIEEVVKEKVFLLGHSSGGLIAAYIASHTKLCSYLILEDPPFFSSQGEKRKTRLIILIYLQFAITLSINRKSRTLFCIISAINTHGIYSPKKHGRK